MIRRWHICIALLVIAASLLQASGAEAKKKKLPLFQPTCGLPVTQSFRLSANLTGCIGDGIVIGANNLTIDLNGKRVEGDGTTGAGIQNFGEFSRLTVRNGTVRFFDDGFHADEFATRNSVINVVAAANANDGVEFDGGSGHLVKGVTASSNDDEGVELDGPTTNSRVIGTWAVYNGSRGLDLDILESKVIGNRASGNGDNGIRIGGDKNQVASNRSDTNGQNGILVDTTGIKNVLKGNKTYGNFGNGIVIGVGSGNILKQNIANGNGYFVQASDGAGLGIDAAADLTVVGRKNKARGNDNPLECTGVTCS
jgi:parallel beta-helix repeat protein